MSNLVLENIKPSTRFAYLHTYDLVKEGRYKQTIIAYVHVDEENNGRVTMLKQHSQAQIEEYLCDSGIHNIKFE